MRMFYEQGERGIQDESFTALPDMFGTVDDFGNLIEFGFCALEDAFEEIPAGAWFFLQSQPLAQSYAGDVHQTGFGI